ncbi:LysR family transcriptional regulator [Veronia nyctiphanis]|uniref:LysR family transcriptional regulator n=1 Tax=Veronia nyctiphanis TaxID=1278244 RepID=A0A4Q0YUP2_9GAMM|nr:LysR substrate-binding domain-containing protein [Veronia nyctiphanis]RXJ72751.1 LysR family transcriptional regulator [Veronia nyctiphanis]
MKIDLNDYFYFVHVVEKNGYTAAAKSLNMPKSRLSRHVAQLEERLGVRLLQRTSRNISVTYEGQNFYVYARKLVDAMEMAESAMENSHGTLAGKVVISCSVGTAQFVLVKLINEFAKLHPKVLIEQRVTNEKVDLVAEGVDIALRAHTNELPDSSLIRRFVANIDWALFCSPAYLEQEGGIDSPQDLMHCQFLHMGQNRTMGAIPLQHQDGLRTHQKTNIILCSEDMSTLLMGATEGLGVVSLPTYVCREALKDGLLVRVLPEWLSLSASLSLLMPSRDGVPPQTQALSAFLRERLPAVVAS